MRNTQVTREELVSIIDDYRDLESTLAKHALAFDACEGEFGAIMAHNTRINLANAQRRREHAQALLHARDARAN